jgi:hypothetical protein
MEIQSLIRAVSAILVVAATGAIVAIVAMPGTVGGRADQMSVAAAALAKPLQKKRCSDCAVVLAIRPLEGSHYEIQLRMSDGSLKSVTSGTRPIWKAGDWVRLQNGKLIG